jgi:hypothetical protein
MANSIWITGSGQAVFGTSLNKNQTDNFLNSGVTNTFTGIGGNINITGIASSGVPTDPATDSNTAIILTAVSPPIQGVKDTFTLHGNTNSLVDTTDTRNSTIKFTVLGNGGDNTVDVTDARKSTITVAIGVDGTATAPAGDNNIFIDNSAAGGTATNTVSVGGSVNTVTLNGDATNKVTFTDGGNTANIGSPPVPGDDDQFGFKSTVTFAGTGNFLFGGDENFTVSGSTGGSQVHLGDGTNVVTMGGTGNIVSVWGGNNTIDAGGSGASVTIFGLDGLNSPAFAPDSDDAPVPASPTDNVTIAGAFDSVTATYENVNVHGTGVNGSTTITLGNGNNSVVLGDLALGNLASASIVTVGNGSNHVNVTGDFVTVNLGSGPNGVVLSGDAETVNVTDPNGLGQDNVQLGAGAGAIGDIVNLDHAGGTVTGTGLGTTTVIQTGKNKVTVNLGGGIGDIALGNGNDTVTANGDGTVITAGNGNDTVTANGNTDTIILGNGNNTVKANGMTDTISLGNGDNTVTANGNNDTFTFGSGNNKLTANGNNDTGTFGAPGNLGGNNTLVAKGSGDTWTFDEKTKSLVTATLGDTSSLTQTGGGLNANLLGDGDTVDATNVGLKGSPASTTNAQGNNETLDWTNSGGNINLNPSSTGDDLIFNGVSDKYAGKVQLTNLTGADPNVDLEDLFNTSGVHITTFSQFLSSLTPSGTGETLNLQGGGSIAFVATNSFDMAKFAFS